MLLSKKIDLNDIENNEIQSLIQYLGKILTESENNSADKVQG